MQKRIEEGYFEDVTANSKRRNPAGILGFLSLPLLVLGLLFSCSWVALVFGQSIPEEDTRSLIAVDYSVWDEIAVQPISLGVIQEVEADRKDGVNLEVIQAPEETGWFWWTPVGTLITPSAGDEDRSQDSLSTLTLTPSVSASATSEGEASMTTTITTTPTTTETLTKTITNTPVFTPTRTNTPTATRTPTSTSTFTPLPSDTPDNTCPPNTLYNFRGTRRFIQWNLQNFSSVPITLESLTLTWPEFNRNLNAVTLGLETIWTGSALPPSITLDSGDWLPADRTIAANSFERLEFVFEGLSASTGYTLTIELSVPCSITIKT